VLTVPLLYLVCHSVALLSKVVLPAHGFYRHGSVFLASLPVVYILVFLTFLVSQFARADLALPKHWPMLLICLAATGISSAIVAALLRTAGNSKFYQRGLGWRCAVALIAAAILAVLVLILGGPELSMFARLKILVGVAPGGTAMQLGPLFWLMHLPFAPILAIMISFGVGYIAKFVVSLAGLLSGPAQPIQRPFFLNGLVMLMASIMLGAAKWAT